MKSVAEDKEMLLSHSFCVCNQCNLIFQGKWSLVWSNLSIFLSLAVYWSSKYKQFLYLSSNNFEYHHKFFIFQISVTHIQGFNRKDFIHAQLARKSRTDSPASLSGNIIHFLYTLTITKSGICPVECYVMDRWPGYRCILDIIYNYVFLFK